MNAPDTSLAVTLYNLREYCRTPADLDRTLARVKEIGYRAVQLSGVGPIAPAEIRDLLEKHGLYCCATHESLDSCLSGFDEVVEKLTTLGCDFTALGHPGNDYWSAEGVAKLAETLSELAVRFRRRGIRFGYHNHHLEFARYTGKTVLRELFDRCDPSLDFEIDVHWVQRGGENPASWVRLVKDRIPVVHLKDFIISGGEPQFAEVGEGNLEWEAILVACREADVRWYVVEQDLPSADRDIFESIAISYRNLTAMGLG